MIVDELLLDSTVEALGMGVHFVRIIPDTNPLRTYAPFRSRRNGGRFGIRLPVGDAALIEALLEAP
ncbi:hypothetical protein [Candidatus Spongiihabitans sp.]|uniref:hypothetical protein n=1 Tax=Candidatus Spongiihabitans sp. TaxID=3101308 RepID=UPI003C704F07